MFYTKYKYYPEDNKMYIPGIIEYYHTSNELNILEPSNQDYQEESGEYHYAKEAAQRIISFHQN